ncbi:MAG: hypothetical protein AAFQ75_00855 [Pseudomonadota bacterium]
MNRIMIAALAALIAAPAAAQDFSEGSEAKNWNLAHGESKARFEAKVTDAVCALTGDCPEDCGAGLRQMVLQRVADGKTLLVFKNIQPIFSGGSYDLAAYCGQTVVVDGLIVGDPEVTKGAEIMQVQTVTVAGETAKTNQFTKAWEARTAEPTGEKGPWFRRDPLIQERLDTTGYFGLGKEEDAKYAEENF